MFTFESSKAISKLLLMGGRDETYKKCQFSEEEANINK